MLRQPLDVAAAVEVEVEVARSRSLSIAAYEAVAKDSARCGNLYGDDEARWVVAIGRPQETAIGDSHRPDDPRRIYPTGSYEESYSSQ